MGKERSTKVIEEVRSMRNDLSTFYNLKCLAKIVPKILKKRNYIKNKVDI